MADLVGIARLCLAAVFLVAGWAKLGDRSRSRRAAADLGVPQAIAGTVGTALPFVELTVGVGLLVSPAAVVMAQLAGGLLVAFIGLVITNLLRGRRPDCNCFGQVKPTPIGGSTLLRNAALLGLAVLVMIAGPGAFVASWADRANGLAFVAAAIAFLTFSFGWFAIRLLREHGVLLARVDELESLLADGVEAEADIHLHEHAAPSELGLPPGTTAPDFSLATLGGTTETLSSLLGPRTALILVFSSDRCVACTNMLPQIAKWQRDDGAFRVVVIGAGDEKSLRAKFRRAGVSDALLAPDDAVARSYAYTATPCAVAVSMERTILSRLHTGEDSIRSLVEWMAQHEIAG